MPEHMRIPKPKGEARRPEGEILAANDAARQAPAEHKSGEELKAELDALLDDIEEVLEENAADFVEGFRQNGGE